MGYFFRMTSIRIIPLQPSEPESDSKKEEYPPLSELDDGVYKGKRYAYVFELCDGRKFRTRTGTRCDRNHCGGDCLYEVKNGELGDKIHPLSILDDGVYRAYRYQTILELEDGRKFDTSPICVKCTKRLCGGLKLFQIENGSFRELEIVD